MGGAGGAPMVGVTKTDGQQEAPKMKRKQCSEKLMNENEEWADER